MALQPPFRARGVRGPVSRPARAATLRAARR